MGEVSRYPEGTFCWVDLGTADVDGAKAFYGALFGWEFESLGVGDFTMCRLDGKDVTGFHAHSEDEGTHWSSYLSVDDVDAATAKARELDAAIVLDPIDVPGAARLSVITDPTGAQVCLWQASGHIGAGLVNEVGCWSWNELTTPDVDAATRFYGEMFGWDDLEIPGVPRVSFTLGELLVAGAHAPIGREDSRARWTVSFRVADADESASRVQELGGSVVLAPMDIPIGRFAIVTDPAGAAFTITNFQSPFQGVDGS